MRAFGQSLRMAAHASDWGDSLNRRCRGGKRNTMVMMFVGGVVLMLDRFFVLFSYRRKSTGQEFFVPARTLMGLSCQFNSTATRVIDESLACPRKWWSKRHPSSTAEAHNIRLGA
jgi:hypothetical protein